MVSMYERSDALIFPSKAETLGLPLIEAKALDLRIIAIDLPHVRSVLKDYDKVLWLSAQPKEAAEQLKQHYNAF